MQVRISTPWRFDLLVASDGSAILAAQFVARGKRSTRASFDCSPSGSAQDDNDCSPPGSAPDDRLLDEAQEQVRAYFARRLRRFDLPLALRGTSFACAVWETVADTEFGEFVSYADVARAIGRPLAHRGVAAAMGRTPIDLFVPAHRVIGADGRVKGATPGGMREWLVAFERQGRALGRTKQHRS